jgi:hypothetical protein
MKIYEKEETRKFKIKIIIISTTATTQRNKQLQRARVK